MKIKIERLKIYLKSVFQIFRIIFILLGSATFILCALAFTSVPYWTRYWLSTAANQYHVKPDYIIMLGGSGMPSADNLMRLYYTAVIAKENPEAPIIILHPPDSSVYLKMKNELINKNIDSTRIFFEELGTNTRSQVLSLAKSFPKTINSKIVIITSPEYMLRSVLVFRKAGFKSIEACPAFEADMNIDLSFDGKKLGGRKYIPEIGHNISLRYNFWSYLKIEISCLREFTAMTYYKFKGWI